MGHLSGTRWSYYPAVVLYFLGPFGKWVPVLKMDRNQCVEERLCERFVRAIIRVQLERREFRSENKYLIQMASVCMQVSIFLLLYILHRYL